MATPFPFQSGQTLLASQLNAITTLPSTTKVASHTLVIADQGTRVIMNSASATTITVNTSIFGAGDIVEIQNIGAGVCTVTAGTATVSSAGPLAIPQFGGGQLFFTSAGVSIFFPTAVTQSPSGLTLVSTTTIGTTVASVTVSNAFSATFDNYRILLTGGVGSTGMGLRLSLGATTTGYYSGGIDIFYAATTTVIGNNNSAFFNFGAGSTSVLSGTADINQPFLAKNTTYFSNHALAATANNSSFSNGFLDNTTSYTAFTITPSGGTMTGGIIRVYGYANS